MMNTRGGAGLSELAGLIDGDVLTDDVARAVYASAACSYRIEPLGVVLPRNTEDVVRTIRFCRQHGLPVIARGGGSGLAGQAVGAGVIIDFTRHMEAVENIDPDAHVARVQPGMTLGVLNALLRPHGKYFPPDPSSANYATIGGMIANNASGSHSLKYGSTIDYVRRLRVVTDTGEVIDAASRPLTEAAGPGDRETELYAGSAKIALRYAPLIETCMPKTSKNSSGYRLDRLIEQDGLATVVHLQRLLCGSEGTLAVIVEADLGIADLPLCSEMVLLAFADLQAAADAVPLMMKWEPSAIEAIDRNGAAVVRERRAGPRKFLPEDAELLIFVEFDGTEREPLIENIRQLKQEMVTERKLATQSIEPADAAERAALWAVRKMVTPTLYSLPGPKRVASFIEDVAVPVPSIPRFMHGLRRILDASEAPFAVLGHVGQGNFHVRPMVDLSDPAEVKRMAAIAAEVFDLVISLGGTVSGEHGDGLVRTEFVRKQYGELYPAFEEIKKLFDPANMLNPGKIVGQRQTLCDNLKFGPQYAAGRLDDSTEMVFDDGEYARLVEKCMGCGACRTLTADTAMCPVFKTIRDERLSPRGKASLLREMLAGNLREAPGNREQVAHVLELCLNCGMCTLECPALAEVPLIINEARARRSRVVGVPLAKRIVSLYPTLSRPMPAILNRLGGKMLEVKPIRTVMEKLVGIDRRRGFPPICAARNPRGARVAQPKRRAAFFADLYASLHDPEIIDCALAVLEHNEVDVVYPRQKEVGIVAMTAGDISAARRRVEYNLKGLGPAAGDGRAIVCAEPSGTLCLKRDYLRFTRDPAARTVAAQCRDFFEFLREMKNDGLLKVDFAEIDEEYIYHTPCHLAAMDIGLPAVEILRQVPGLRIRVLTKNCCGMAGSFGVTAKNYDLSAQIGRRLFDEIAESGCPRVLTECASCKMQIEEQTGTQVTHPVKLLHRAYGL